MLSVNIFNACVYCLSVRLESSGVGVLFGMAYMTAWLFSMFSFPMLLVKFLVHMLCHGPLCRGDFPMYVLWMCASCQYLTNKYMC